MYHAPVIVPPNLSARAQDLARRLEHDLDEYLRRHPSTSERDVRQALHALARRRARGASTALLLGAALLLGLLALASLVFWFYRG